MPEQHIPRGNANEAGDVQIYDGWSRTGAIRLATVPFALLIQFPDETSLKAALARGRCEFTVFGEEKGGEA